MRAESEEEVREHVRNCQVFVDTTVHIERLLTVSQAQAENALFLSEILVGAFKDGPSRDGSDLRPEFRRDG